MLAYRGEVRAAYPDLSLEVVAAICNEWAFGDGRASDSSRPATIHQDWRTRVHPGE